jgi:hypothetical protein
LQQGNYRFGAGNEFTWVDAKVEMIFHVLHTPVHILFEPLFKAARIGIEFLRFRDTAIREAELTGCFFTRAVFSEKFKIVGADA